MFRYLAFFFIITSIFIITGCSHNEIYRSKFDTICSYTNKNDCEPNSLQIHSKANDDEYHLAFVEFDDQGQLRDQKQMSAVINQYYQLASKDDVILVTFVHGWHHNAGLEDSNISGFRENVLRKISKDESIASNQQKRKRRKVLGVYIGWRGESIEIPGISMLTFWDRKNTAHEVGQLGVTELLLKLEELVNIKKANAKGQVPINNSKMVVVGHSFGGAVVFSSLQKILMERFIDSNANKNSTDNAKGFADLVVLINPAFEALRFSALFDLSQRSCRAYFKSQLPKLAILTSETDWATSLAFPAGRLFSTFFESHKKVKAHSCTEPGSEGKKEFELIEGEADRTAVGHFDNYLTHDLLPAKQLVRDNTRFDFSSLQNKWASNQGNISFNGSELKSRGITTYLNPYLNIKVNEELSDGHNDIWKPELVSFIEDLILISTLPSN